MLEVTKQRPMNNEYANAWISKLSPVTLILPENAKSGVLYVGVICVKPWSYSISDKQLQQKIVCVDECLQVGLKSHWKQQTRVKQTL